MRLVAITILVACFSLARSQKPEISAKALEIAPPPVKLDKNLRQALLKALTELEAESAEQRKDEDEKSLIMTVEKSFDEVVKKNLNNNIGVPKTSFSFDGFPGDEEIPNEEKLQNSSFLESKRYVSSSLSSTIEKASRDDARSFHVQKVQNILPNKNTTSRTESKVNPLEIKKLKTSEGSSTVSKVESITLKPITQLSESLTQSASNGITSINALITPKPTASSPTVSPNSNITLSSNNKEKLPAEEVKIFQAPLVAAFTVQQDELGIPKSIVPIYRQSGDGQALTLQEQLEFKQKLLEKQLAELQQQQIQQTQFLIRQRQLYDQQLRQKQQQLYLQEQARIKHLEEQAKIKQLEEHRLKQLEEQRIYRLHQHNHFPLLQKSHIFEQSNVLPLQPPQSPLESTVHLQPSVSLEVPSVATPPLFRTNYQEQLHFQQFRQQPQTQPQPQSQPQLQQQHQHQHQHQQQHQHQHQHQQQQHQHQHQHQQQQRLYQNFVSFPTDFQLPVVPATRFNRQEAFNAVGNFGLNLDKQPPPLRNTFNFNALPRNPNTFVYNPYVQFRQIPTRTQTPAKQIQRLLYQSGVAGELGNVQGPGDEDLNIVSKVLALNVGALPNKNYQYITNNRGKLGSA